MDCYGGRVCAAESVGYVAVVHPPEVRQSRGRPLKLHSQRLVEEQDGTVHVHVGSAVARLLVPNHLLSDHPVAVLPQQRVERVVQEVFVLQLLPESTQSLQGKPGAADLEEPADREG
eukprot:746504-Hanusia_phi.AAC.10